jgi:hypothetical protein
MMKEKTLSQALAEVEFVIDRHGETKGVFLPLKVWEAMVEALEDAEDLSIAREYLIRKAGTRSLKEMNLVRWEDVAHEWDDDQTSTTQATSLSDIPRTRGTRSTV